METVIIVLILLFSSVLHEFMHGFTAYKLGDPTAKLLGRLTLNPLAHIDPFTSVLLPALLIFSGSPIIFGAAKPVPVNPAFLKEGRKDFAIVALAGPLTNITIAIIFSFILKLVPFSSYFFVSFFQQVVIYNLMLAIINLIPIPPLDGSRIFSVILPSNLAKAYFSLEPYGIFILFFLLLFPIGGLNLGLVINRLILFSLRLLGGFPFLI